MVEATRKYKKIVQTGFMNRSRPAVRDAIRFLHEGGIGDVYMARGLCFKPRPPIGRYPDGPLKPGEEYRLNVESKEMSPPGTRRYLVEGGLRPVARPGAAAALQPQPLPLQLALALGLRQRRHRQPGTAPVRRGALGPQGRLSSRAGLVHGRPLRLARNLAGDPRRADVLLRVRGRHACSSSPPAAPPRTTRAASASATSSTAPRAGSTSTAMAASGRATWAARTRRAPAPTRVRPPPRAAIPTCSRARRAPTTRTSSTPCARATRPSSPARSRKAISPRPFPTSRTSPIACIAA